VFLNLIPAQDILRIGKMDGFEIEMKGFETSPSSQQMDFNLDNPILADIDVRHAIAHAIDRKWITDNVWYGLGKPGMTPLHHDQTEYFTTEGVPAYDYDLAKANELLDKKYPKKDGGMRFALTLDPSPWGTESITAATYIKEQMRQIGIDLTVRTQDFAVFVKTVYTERKHDLALYTAYMGTDPTIGVQRFYWSKSFKPGVGFANGAHYSNPEVDAVLEAAQIETDAAKRKEQYKKFQQLAMADLPVLVVTTISMATVAKKSVRDHAIDAVGSLGNLAHTWIDA
jgi:peptide/nickel transport system substrate-binding protein